MTGWQLALSGLFAYLIAGFIVSVITVRLEWRDQNRKKGGITEYSDLGPTAALYALLWPLVLALHLSFLIADTAKPVMRFLYTPVEVRKSPPVKAVTSGCEVGEW